MHLRYPAKIELSLILGKCKIFNDTSLLSVKHSLMQGNPNTKHVGLSIWHVWPRLMQGNPNTKHVCLSIWHVWPRLDGVTVSPGDAGVRLSGAVLSLVKVQRSQDAGVYTCTASVKRGRSATAAMQVNVLGETIRRLPVWIYHKCQMRQKLVLYNK